MTGLTHNALTTINKSVLLVEDNPDDEILALRAFRKHGIDSGISVVRDGAEAIDFLFAQGKHADRATKGLPTVVLLDLNLPKLNGLEVLRTLRSNDTTRHLPVVILTTSKEQRDLVDGYRSGANSFISKPVDYDEFLDAIEQLGRYWLLLNRTPDSAVAAN